jgi:uncharacterized protein (DUF58 family)
MRQPLPDPHWTELPESCVGCGYSLAGLAVPGVCPECGVPYEQGCLTLAGVPRRSSSSTLRRAGWIGLIAVAAIYSQVFLALLFFLWWAALVGAVVILAGLAGMYVTSPRERSGSERFLVTRAGIVRSPQVVRTSDNSQHSVLIPWGSANTVELKRISSVWRRLRVGTGNPSGRGSPDSVIFDAGIRCTDEAVEEVQRTIESMLAMTRDREHGSAQPRTRVL